MKISQRVSKLFGGQHFHCEIFKGHYSVKNVGRVMVLFFFFFFFSLYSAHPLMMLYICIRFVKISKRVLELLSGHNFHSEIFKGA